jgi:acyl-CoA reductase-like NAD-dependent aldehyde dehydrogenase
MHKYRMRIGGKWVDAETGETFAAFNPATEEEIGRVPLGGIADVDKAVVAAQEALPVWSKKSQAERSQILCQVADAIEERAKELAELDIVSHGTPRKPALFGVMGLPQMFRYNAQASRSFMGQVISANPNKFCYLQREPRGVCALIVAWNAPLVGATKKLSAALATGNTCIIKPPSICSLTVLKLVEILENGGLPAGTVNVVTGFGDMVGEALSSHPGVSMVSFTGSCETGKRIMSVASKTVKHLTMELGGNNPCIVLEDADIDAAVAYSLFSSFHNSGMVCAATGRYYIHEKLYDDFVTKFVSRAGKMVVGDPTDEKTEMGPVVSAEHRDRVEDYIKSGVKEGAKLVLGGKRPTTPPLDRGYFVMPTVFTNVTQNMRIAREEIFGPVACFIKFSSDEEVIGLANDSTYGLSASVWTRNTRKGIRFANGIQAGTVWINGDILGPEYPWGGYKQSGFGKENSILGLEEYVQVKAISFDMSGKE